MDALTDEWTSSLLNTVSDPLVNEQKSYMSAEQQKVIDNLLMVRELPENTDSYFVNTVTELLQGFEAVTVKGAELIEQLSALGPCDAATFKEKINEVVASLTKGKDKTKLRIIVR